MPSLLIIIGSAIALLLLLIIVSYRQQRFAPEHTTSDSSTARITARSHQKEEEYELSPIPLSEPNTPAKWMILDLQTTGLSTEVGAEDYIVEATWLTLDQDFRLVNRHTKRVRQNTAGSSEARQVHGISEKELVTYGITEIELIQALREDLTEDMTLVMHNAHFDLSILYGTVVRIAPDWLPTLLDRSALCTMKYRLGHQHLEEKYPSLPMLTAELCGVPGHSFYHLRPVSWRNAYFTRLCLIQLLARHPELLGENLLPLESYLTAP